MFEMVDRDCTGRIGILHTAHGKVRTPALLPVVNPHRLTISPEELHSTFGFQALITNSYIIRKDEFLKDRALEEGVHALLGFPGAVMTDSGTFQAHVYGKVHTTNEEIVSFQRDMGVDIGTALDVFTEPWDGPDTAREAMEETLSRVEEAASIKGDMALAGTVQGGVYPSMREEMAVRLGNLDVDVHPVGGVVPLLENYRFRDLVRLVLAAKRGLPPGRPVHLFGAGHPMVFALGTLMGCDLYDSSSYAKYAADGRLMYTDGTRHLEDLGESPCGCPVCREHDGPSLRDLPDEERERALASHNLWACLDELRVVREAIREGTLWDLVDRRSRAHPLLFDGYRELCAQAGQMEPFESTSKPSALHYTDHYSMRRPIVMRYARRIFSRYASPEKRVMVGFDEGSRPYGRHYSETMEKVLEVADAQFLVKSVLGPVPIELDEMYPVAQTVESAPWDAETVKRVNNLMEHTSHNLRNPLAVMYDGEETLDMLRMMEGAGGTFDIMMARARATADMQFGKGAADVLMDGSVELVTSKRTGKLRNVLVDGDHVLSMRAQDGLYTLKTAGARRLHGAWESPRLRVVVNEDAAPFAREGRSQFAQFVVEADPELRPGDEVLVVDEADSLLAVGRTHMNRKELLSFRRGVAVKVRVGAGVKEDN
ncbi:MAG: tRNA guanosine(15) transglycosylase TgtA [Thermoplasmata archaeon]|nr:MAG: tRNA guanosine(15) transglycosylase TgtA [Thermoplasmata archaeon]